MLPYPQRSYASERDAKPDQLGVPAMEMATRPNQKPGKPHELKPGTRELGYERRNTY